MDKVRNPFAPGAGSKPPELVGRDQIIEDASIDLQRIRQGRHAKSCIFRGLRGTGKTVLLHKIGQLAEEHDCLAARIEAPEGRRLADLLYPELYNALRRLSLTEQSKALAIDGMQALRSFASVFKIKAGDLSIAVDPEPGIADSGHLESDLSTLLVRVARAAQTADTALVLLIDEIQYLSHEELGALAASIHRCNQDGSPLIFFGAGLPQITGILGEAKSYSERLFEFVTINSLDRNAATDAIRLPIEQEGESISNEALAAIIDQTKGYPYFLQEWGYQTWNVAEASPMRAEHVQAASDIALQRLDDGFFRVRLDRLTPKEREYVIAMASLGAGPCKTPDIAEKLGENMQALGPRRASIIKKGIAYSPEHGGIEFTVPMFANFLKRNYPPFEPETP